MASQRGFTLVEIVAAVTLAALLIGLAVPQGLSFYQSMQFRSGVRETLALLNAARYAAVTKGRAQDVEISPESNWVRFGDDNVSFDDDVEIAVNSAKEVNRGRLGIIRFYPDGGSSGGGLEIRRRENPPIQVNVDWLVGRVILQSENEDA